MNHLNKINHSSSHPQLHISHQSEVLLLRNELAALRVEMNELRQQMNQIESPPRQERITLSGNGQHYFVNLDDIIYCEADGSYTKVFIQNKNYSCIEQPTELSRRGSQRVVLISKTLKSVVDLIASANFIRCHQSYFVNRKYVSACKLDNGLTLILTNEKAIPVSRRNKKEVMEMYSI